jgi:hypothetical protein
VSDELTPAAVLRAAAGRLRESAGKATRGPWKAVPNPYIGGWAVTPCTADDDAAYLYVADFTDEPTANYIALVHPGVGLALAGWLESLDGVEFSEHGPLPDEFAHALAVARAVLAV